MRFPEPVLSGPFILIYPAPINLRNNFHLRLSFVVTTPPKKKHVDDIFLPFSSLFHPESPRKSNGFCVASYIINALFLSCAMQPISFPIHSPPQRVHPTFLFVKSPELEKNICAAGWSGSLFGAGL